MKGNPQCKRRVLNQIFVFLIDLSGLRSSNIINHRGYAVVCLSPVIKAVGVTSIGGNACNSDRLDHRT